MRFSARGLGALRPGLIVVARAGASYPRTEHSLTTRPETIRDLEFFGYFPEGPKICADLKECGFNANAVDRWWRRCRAASPAQQRVLWLFIDRDLSASDVARFAGLSYSTVRIHLAALLGAGLLEQLPDVSRRGARTKPMRITRLGVAHLGYQPPEAA